MSGKPSSPTKGRCPMCHGERSCNVHGFYMHNWQFHDGSVDIEVSGTDEHHLLQCRGCETVFYECRSTNSENYDVWIDHTGAECMKHDVELTTFPKPDAKNRPEWFEGLSAKDHVLYKILRQVYLSRDNDAYILAAIGLRTAIDRATEVLKIPSQLPFVKKLKKLEDGGWIGQSEREVLDVITDAGSAAAHRGWEPDENEFNQLLNATEAFLHRAFIIGLGALELKAKIPSKQKTQNQN